MVSKNSAFLVLFTSMVLLAASGSLILHELYGVSLTAGYNAILIAETIAVIIAIILE